VISFSPSKFWSCSIGREFYEYQKLIKIVLRMWAGKASGLRIQAEKRG
jgi:hypothetical protein